MSSQNECRDVHACLEQDQLKRWAEAHGDAVTWFRDTFSGTMEHPGWSKLSDAIGAGKIGKVVVWRLDRLGRTAKGLTALFEELAERKVNLISLRDGIDLHTSAGRLMANVLVSVAQFETELRAERVRAGQQAARKRGVRWGGSKPGWRWKVTNDQAAAVAEMKKGGKKIAQIARATGGVAADGLPPARTVVPSCSALRRRLPLDRYRPKPRPRLRWRCPLGRLLAGSSSNCSESTSTIDTACRITNKRGVPVGKTGMTTSANVAMPFVSRRGTEDV